MSTRKLIKWLKEFLDFSKKKQKKKCDKFLRIVKKLEGKRSKVETELAKEGRHDESSKRYHELRHELKVIIKLIKKSNELALSN